MLVLLLQNLQETFRLPFYCSAFWKHYNATSIILMLSRNNIILLFKLCISRNQHKVASFIVILKCRTAVKALFLYFNLWPKCNIG